MVFLMTGSASAVPIGKTAPDFSLNDIDGNIVRLGDFKGQVVILNFWSTTCAPCVAEIPALNTLYRDLKGSGLTVLGLSLDRTITPVRELADRQHIAYPLLMDSLQDVYFDTYALFGQPVSIVIDRSGMIREKLVGQVEWSSAQIRSKIITLLKGR
jgi:peroxiredoxin